MEHTPRSGWAGCWTAAVASAWTPCALAVPAGLALKLTVGSQGLAGSRDVAGGSHGLGRTWSIRTPRFQDLQKLWPRRRGLA